MDIAKLEPRADDAAELLGAMSNPKRLLILCHLLDEELGVNQLSELVGLAQSPLSQHLSKLRALKLVATRRDGQSILYRLASDDVARILTTLYGIYCAPREKQGRAPRAPGAKPSNPARAQAGSARIPRERA
ncbi:MAG TPA: metalloregulator ArsR/SmtB family transcription factor [Devosia sp.]|nr:metalloregulator ArsR/SmtB family transcription factor [Devosia sp.]